MKRAADILTVFKFWFAAACVGLCLFHSYHEVNIFLQREIFTTNRETCIHIGRCEGQILHFPKLETDFQISRRLAINSVK